MWTGLLHNIQRTQQPRFASERVPGTKLWNVTVNIPGPPLGSASSLDDAEAQFRAAWLAFRERHGPDRLAKAYREMNKRL